MTCVIVRNSVTRVVTRTGQYSSWRRCCRKNGRPTTNIRVVLAPQGKVAGSSRVETGVTHAREGGRTARMPLGGLLKTVAEAVAQTTTRKTIVLSVRQKRLRVIAGERVVMVCQGVVWRVVLLGRLRSLAGWCVPRQGHLGV